MPATTRKQFHDRAAVSVLNILTPASIQSQSHTPDSPSCTQPQSSTAPLPPPPALSSCDTKLKAESAQSAARRVGPSAAPPPMQSLWTNWTSTWPRLGQKGRRLGRSPTASNDPRDSWYTRLNPASPGRSIGILIIASLIVLVLFPAVTWYRSSARTFAEESSSRGEHDRRPLVITINAADQETVVPTAITIFGGTSPSAV